MFIINSFLNNEICRPAARSFQLFQNKLHSLYVSNISHLRDTFLSNFYFILINLVIEVRGHLHESVEP